MAFPSSTRSSVVTPFATKASRQAAHSIADPRASSKNFARTWRCRLPLPSAVFSSEDKLARSNWPRTSLILPASFLGISSRSAVTQAMNFNSKRYTSSFSWSNNVTIRTSFRAVDCSSLIFEDEDEDEDDYDFNVTFASSKFSNCFTKSTINRAAAPPSITRWS